MINKTSFISKLYNLYKPKMKTLTQLEINTIINDLGKSDELYLIPSDICKICEVIKVSCYGFDSDNNCIAKSVSPLGNYRSFVWKSLEDDIEIISCDKTRRHLIGKVSSAHLVKPKPIKICSYYFCDTCNSKHKYILNWGITYRPCLEKWFICGKTKSKMIKGGDSQGFIDLLL